MARLNAYEIEIETKTVQITKTERKLKETETKVSNALKTNELNAIQVNKLKQKTKKHHLENCYLYKIFILTYLIIKNNNNNLIIISFLVVYSLTVC
jgi:hypothetical protein